MYVPVLSQDGTLSLNAVDVTNASFHQTGNPVSFSESVLSTSITRELDSHLGKISFALLFVVYFQIGPGIN